MNEQQTFGNNAAPDQLYEMLRQRESRGEYALAEPIVLQILETPGQPPPQYLYLPAAGTTPGWCGGTSITTTGWWKEKTNPQTSSLNWKKEKK